MIKIMHLYYDIMNLYGENGNIKAIEHHLNTRKINYQLDKKSIHDDIDFLSYDLVYLGSSTENNQKIVLKHILNYKEDIKKYINNNKTLIATGNALDLFGNYIESNNKKFQALGIFQFSTKELEKRIVNDISIDNIQGFYNSGSQISNFNKPMFNKKKFKDGYREKNFYGTKLLGPLLVRNEWLLNQIIENIKTS